MKRRGIVIAHGDAQITGAIADGIQRGRNQARERKRPSDAGYYRELSEIRRDIIRIQTQERIDAEERWKREKVAAALICATVCIALITFGMVVVTWRYG